MIFLKICAYVIAAYLIAAILIEAVGLIWALINLIKKHRRNK